MCECVSVIHLICFTERLGCHVRARGLVQVSGLTHRWTLQFGPVTIPTRLGMSLREVSKGFSSVCFFLCVDFNHLYCQYAYNNFNRLFIILLKHY